MFSRQRYWGEPIPIVHCDKCGFVPIPEDQLPLKLPEIEDFEQTEDGQSPLAKLDSWVNTTCPCCGGPAQRETDTMPQWAGSSWYFLRYTDPKNTEALASKEALKYWLPVDWYNGGMEHTTLHLLYSRFWHRFLYDQGVVPTKEPYQKRTSHGMILGENGEKMSKSRGKYVSDTVPGREQLPHHKGICARIWSTEDAAWYAPYRHCTSQQASSISMLPGLPVLYHCADQYSAGNTRMIRPTEAWYPSLA